MLPLPAKRTTDPQRLADWVELNALLSPDGQVSMGNLVTAIKAGSVFPETSSRLDERIDSLLSSVSSAIRSRARNADIGYPFVLRGSSVERLPKWQTATYTFCLCTSYLGLEAAAINGHFPTRMFEAISVDVAHTYLGGKAVRFGWPRVRSHFEPSFAKAVEQLCKLISTNDVGYRNDEANGDEKDDGVDVVAWCDIDERPGKLVLFGGCAAGDDWEAKLKELQPDTFCKAWMTAPLDPVPIKTFFTTRTIDETDWTKYTRRAGILFDRCRVSRFVPQLPANTDHGNARDWTKAALANAAAVGDASA